ncbi:polyvinylalcohol dehydrogenase [Eucalyptus grandis]|uniref:polyvinylalcohol dehydrogenase n=1 Tax=Eucalyptus grandis TaxID=71139 RepID=UPI00192E9DEC|nr:polyvinylalcohol dehydrogenase [Eucalyptus grandis]
MNASDGSLVWKQNLSELTGLRGTTIVNVTLSRSTPTIAEKLRLARSVVRGSLVKLNILPGAILWQTYTLPDNGGELRGYDGACIWGSSPAIDPKRRLAYVATGNHYTAPAKVQECQARQNNQTIPPTAPDQCIGPDVNFNSIIAFEMESGRIRGSDADHDPHDIAVVVQMSGFAWAVDHDSRDIVWFRNFTLAPSTQTTTAGAWVALDGRSGEVLWSTANPSNEMAPTPVSVANGVMFACSVAPEGPVFAMDAETGKILRSYNSGATVYGGISISYGCIYHGNGYKLGL